MQSMSNIVDRKRLKDRILDNISKAVKQIQEYHLCSSSNSEDTGVVLVNDDWQFCKLVESLDHALLHGLRHITSGYWVVVQEFTHKATVKEIRRCSNVTTNLGRGRAWLYMALMDHLLESYMRCFLDNVKLVKRYYAKEAFVLDPQRMQLLLTLASGIEYVTFQLEVNVPYLDLSSHLKPRKMSRDDSHDRLSLCSMDSSMSQSSSMTEDLTTSIDLNSDGTSQYNSETPDSDRDSPRNNQRAPIVNVHCVGNGANFNGVVLR